MKDQLHSISGEISGLEVRVLPGSPNSFFYNKIANCLVTRIYLVQYDARLKEIRGLVDQSRSVQNRSRLIDREKDQVRKFAEIVQNPAGLRNAITGRSAEEDRIAVRRRGLRRLNGYFRTHAL